MSVYKREDTKNYMCEFTLRGVKVRQSTGEHTKREAEAWERLKRKDMSLS